MILAIRETRQVRSTLDSFFLEDTPHFCNVLKKQSPVRKRLTDWIENSEVRVWCCWSCWKLKRDVPENKKSGRGAPKSVDKFSSNCWLTTKLQVPTMRPRGIQWKTPVELKVLSRDFIQCLVLGRQVLEFKSSQVGTY